MVARSINLKWPRTMVLADIRWVPGGAVFEVTCSCGLKFDHHYTIERVRCPGCGAEANLPTLKREWGDVPFEITGRSYLVAYQLLRLKLKTQFRLYDKADPEAMAKLRKLPWLKRLWGKWRETRESISAGD